MKSNNQRQAEHHKKMVESGYKKRSFYVKESTIKAMQDYKEKHGLDNLADVLDALLLAGK